MLSDTPINLLKKHINGDFARDIRSMNVLYEIITHQYLGIKELCEYLSRRAPEEVGAFETDLNELEQTVSMAWPLQ
jgi:hypothetical protein